MKKLFTLLTLTAIAVGTPATFAAEKKAKAAAETPADAKKPAESAKPAAEKVAGEGKAIPMYVRADAIDPAAKTITSNRKDGTSVKHVLTADTTVKNGEAAAKLEDIKVGDYVSGSRKKVSDTEYTVVKITKFGPKAEKKEGDAKPAEGAAKPAEKKAK